MVIFFKKGSKVVFALLTEKALTDKEIDMLTWLFDGAKYLSSKQLSGTFIGPRKEMITPWSTNAVEITQNMGIQGITRIEQFERQDEGSGNFSFDPMLQAVYKGLGQTSLTTTAKAQPIKYITDIHVYNIEEGLALSSEEETYLKKLSEKLGRPLTDSEVFGFSQVNSEHCRHKIFNGSFIIDGEKKPYTLFQLIKKTSQTNPNGLVSAYKDNVAFVKGPVIEQFAPKSADKADIFAIKKIPSVLSLKAETHNFPTTVEPFNGAATGSGGEIRDRLGGGKASLPLAGTAVYMTSYPRLDIEHPWEAMMDPRQWLYQTPAQILIKASNGASDFGNKYGQPLICGSLLTFEHNENNEKFGFDKVIMLAGGVGYAAAKDAIKGVPDPNQKVVVMGGDNYRIGMGGGAVSSVNTGQYAGAIELNAVQRANPEMQKRVSNVIRALAESDNNPIVSIHDHGAGGHLNALSELVEATGGKINMAELPIGDPTLSAKEIIGNESQERMGLIINKEDIPLVEKIAARERAPFFVVGETTNDKRFVFEQADGNKPIDLEIADMLGNSPRTIMEDISIERNLTAPHYEIERLEDYLKNVLSLEAVACKDWLTNKVDRSVTGKIARQQCVGEIQLPLSDCGVVSIDYTGKKGIATSIGHAPQAAVADPAKGSVLAISEALTNIVGAPLSKGIKSLSLSANWMWPCRNEGEDAALYKAVESCSQYACEIGVNIPTGKDSLSMTQKYGDEKVLAPGTVIISAAGEVSDVKKTVSPVIKKGKSVLLYIDFSNDKLSLGGSALAQTLGKIGSEVPTVTSPEYFVNAFEVVQKIVRNKLALALHDVSAGGLAVTLLEMCFPNTKGGIMLDTRDFGEKDLVKVLFAENPAVVLQVKESNLSRVKNLCSLASVKCLEIGSPVESRELIIKHDKEERFSINKLRDVWFYPSYLLDTLQSGKDCARSRYENYSIQPLRYKIPSTWNGSLNYRGIDLSRTNPTGIKAAIIREKGVNGDREMAYSLHLAGFDVKDIHMTDLTSGRENLEDVNMIVFCGGFSNSDVLGSAKGWAGGFKWNSNARKALKKFYDREDTLSLGICNGCQLMIELGVLTPHHSKQPHMGHNISHKFESQFLGLTIPKNNSVMLKSLEGMKLGVWVAHGEGRFELPLAMKEYNVAARYSYSAYPGNPNGSKGNVAAITSDDGRHLAMMPHPERAIFPWQCAYWPDNRKSAQVTPWIDAFISARRWIEEKTQTK